MSEVLSGTPHLATRWVSSRGERTCFREVRPSGRQPRVGVHTTRVPSVWERRMADDWTVVGKKSRRKMSANAFKVLQGQVETHGGPAEDGPGVTTEKVHQQLDRTVVELRAAAFVAQLKRRMSERGFGVMCPADREHPADLAGAPLPAAKKERRFEKMVILGLGSPSNSSTARLQLALALVLAEFLGLPLDVIELYDPVFSPIDGEVLKTRGMRVLTRDESDRYVGPSASPTEAPMFFFMPHCEAVLYEGLLRANWAAPESLRGHAVLGNNFETYVERWSHRMDAEEGCPKHILAAAPLTEAIGVDPDATFAAAATVGAFNDTSVQIIGGESRSALPEVP